jgi:hypothetical protein
MSIFDSKDPILLKIVIVFLIGLMLLEIYYSLTKLFPYPGFIQLKRKVKILQMKLQSK